MAYIVLILESNRTFDQDLVVWHNGISLLDKFLVHA